MQTIQLQSMANCIGAKLMESNDEIKLGIRMKRSDFVSLYLAVLTLSPHIPLSVSMLSNSMCLHGRCEALPGVRCVSFT